MRITAILLLPLCFIFMSCKTTIKEVASAPVEIPQKMEVQKKVYQADELEERYYSNIDNRQEVIKLIISKDNQEIIDAKFLGLGSEYAIEFSNLEYSEEFGLMAVATSKAWNGEALVGLRPGSSQVDLIQGKTRKVFQ